MNVVQTAVYTPIRWLARILLRVDDAELAKIPVHGPLILAANHVNWLDVPVLYTHLMPRPVTGFAKIETWNNPALGFLFSLGGAIPIRRGMVDRSAIDAAMAVLQNGGILAIAPEGTRTGDGRLRRARPGIAMLAAESGATVIPVAYYGGERFHRNIMRLRRTDFHFRVGKPFTVRPGAERLSREERQQIADDIMYRIAALMPAKYAGFYSAPPAAPCPFVQDAALAV